MSTEIKEIKGRYEAYGAQTYYNKCRIHINRFAGGENGAMIQLTIMGNSNGYIQLTKKQVMELAETLKDSYDYDKYPSE